MPRLSVSLLAALLMLPSALPAQWQVTLLNSSARSSGHAVSDDDEPLTVGPDHPGTLGLTVQRMRGSWRLGLRARRTTADLSLRGPETAILTRGDLNAWGGSLELGRQLIHSERGPTLLGVAGVSLDRWTFPVSGGDARMVRTLHAALEGQVPFTSRIAGIVRAEGALGGSVFTSDELPPGYAVRTGRQWGIGLGVGWSP